MKTSLELVKEAVVRIKALPESERRKIESRALVEGIFDGSWILDYNSDAKPSLAECAAFLILEMDELPRKCQECGGTGVLKKGTETVPCFECLP